MRRLVVMLIVLGTGSVVYAQVQVGGRVPMPLPGVAPVPFYGPSTSVIDRNAICWSSMPCILIQHQCWGSPSFCNPRRRRHALP